ncbi:MAG: polyketide synthase dehydratase domain-containing protein [Desulfobacterales bacterium]
MEDFSPIVASARRPVEIPHDSHLKDHCFEGRAVLPAVEATEILARAAIGFRPGTGVTAMAGLRFDKFLYLDTRMQTTAAFCDVALNANGAVRAALATRTQVKPASMTRLKEHAAGLFFSPEASRPSAIPGPPPDTASALAEVGDTIEADSIYPDLVPFGPAYRNLTRLRLGAAGVVADIRTPVEPAGGNSSGRRLGSPFALDAALQAACVWGRRFADIFAFPVGIDRRRIFRRTGPGNSYVGHVYPVRVEPPLLVFDLWIVDAAGRLCETASGVRMRAVKRGWVKTDR